MGSGVCNLSNCQLSFYWKIHLANKFLHPDKNQLKQLISYELMILSKVMILSKFSVKWIIKGSAYALATLELSALHRNN